MCAHTNKALSILARRVFQVLESATGPPLGKKYNVILTGSEAKLLEKKQCNKEGKAIHRDPMTSIFLPAWFPYMKEQYGSVPTRYLAATDKQRSIVAFVEKLNARLLASLAHLPQSLTGALTKLRDGVAKVDSKASIQRLVDDVDSELGQIYKRDDWQTVQTVEQELVRSASTYKHSTSPGVISALIFTSYCFRGNLLHLIWCSLDPFISTFASGSTNHR